MSILKTRLTIGHVIIYTRNDNGSYTVTFPDFPGCITEGGNFHEAEVMAKEALRLHLEELGKV